MAIADWFIAKSDAGMDVHLEIGGPIDGTGSLRITQEAISASTAVATAHLRPVAGSPQSQFTKGKIRTLIKPVSFADTGTTVSFAGIIAMMNQANVFDPGGAAYVAGRWGGASPSWFISKVAGSGITGGGSFVHLATGNIAGLPGIGDVRAIEFEWIVDPLEFNGVRLTFKASPDSSFTNLAPIYQVVDTSAFLSSTVGEGLFMSSLHSAPVGQDDEFLYDNTTIFELIPA
jgi:hypothetical protein